MLEDGARSQSSPLMPRRTCRVPAMPGWIASHRIHGGASRQTYSIDLAYEDATGPKVKGLILRRDPPDSLIDTERRVEFAAIKSAYGQRDLPVPEALFLETDQAALGAPFFVMGRIESR